MSKREINKLEELSGRFKEMSTSGLSAVTREFAEWVKNFVPDTPRPIPWRDALASTKSEVKIDMFEQKLAEQQAIDAIFALATEGEVEARA